MPTLPEQQLDKKERKFSKTRKAALLGLIAAGAVTGCGEKDATATPVPTETATSTSTEQVSNDAELLETDPQAYVTEKVLNREELTQEEYDAVAVVLEQPVESPLAKEIVDSNVPTIIDAMVVPGAQDLSWVNDEQDKARMANLATLGESISGAMDAVTIPEELQNEDAFLEEARRVNAYSLTKYAHDNMVDLKTFNEVHLPENGIIDVESKKLFVENTAWDISDELETRGYLDGGALNVNITKAIQQELTERSFGENLPSQLDLEVTANSINEESLGGEKMSYWADAVIGIPGRDASYEKFVLKVQEQPDGTDRISGIEKRAQ